MPFLPGTKTFHEHVATGDQYFSANGTDSDIPITDAAAANADINQIVAYAEMKHCRHGALIYPVPLRPPLNERVNRFSVRSLTFALHGDLDIAGRAFIERLTAWLAPSL